MQYLPHNEELSALIKQNHCHMEVGGRRLSRIVGVTGREGRLSWEARAEEVSFDIY